MPVKGTRIFFAPPPSFIYPAHRVWLRLEAKRQSPIGGMGHACELETSLILHLRPELVHLERAVDEMDFISTPSYYMDWIEGGALTANPPWDDDTRTGAYGAGSLGTAEKGAILVESGHPGESWARRRDPRTVPAQTRQAQPKPDEVISFVRFQPRLLIMSWEREFLLAFLMEQACWLKLRPA